MPEPGDNESHDDFIDRCIPIVLDEGTASNSDQAVAICNSLWEEDKKSMDYAVKVLKQTDDAVLIGGFGVIFGGKDLYEDTFTEETDFMLDMVPIKQIMYRHGALEDVDHFIGKSTNEILRKAGLWVEAQLETHQAYVDEILELIDKKALGWSSQAASSLVKYADDWHTILRWPIIEHSLTPTPAEPRTIGVERIKALAIENPRLKALLPKSNKHIQLRARAHLALE